MPGGKGTRHAAQRGYRERALSDPNVPVIRNYRMPDGTTKVEVDPEYERRYREHMMDASAQPTYRDDPTYNLKKPRRKRAAP